jgi:hypothetical protein
MMFVKLSIGVFLLRLAVWTAYKWILWISLVVFTLWSLGIFFWNLLQCIPVEKQWDFRIEHGYCAGADAIISSAIALSVLTVLSDWVYVCPNEPVMYATTADSAQGSPARADGMERKDDQASQDYCRRHSRPGNFVRLSSTDQRCLL